MFPVRDDNPHFLTPWVTWSIIAANALAWAFWQGLGSEAGLAHSLCDYGLIPGELFGRAEPGTAVPLSPNYTCVVDPSGDWRTVITHMFLHGGWFHLIGNMWFLWIFGNNVEDSMGHARFVAFYLLCGLAAAALQALASPASPIPMVGASGAIGGVMGAYVVLYPRVRVHLLLWLGFYVTTVAVPAAFMLLYWLVVQLVGGATSIGKEGGGVAFWAHVGGFVAGMALVLVFRDPRLVARHPYHGWSAPRRPV
ncbi:MAG: rhomboid family intramembrane serine protease [Proteobacteria bacterium]|nr:MAG: rhomboid family intramembrane serine protease [Pseudomonadota bacterium]